MKVFKYLVRAIGIILVGWIGLYMFMLLTQTSDVKSICEAYPIGATLPSLQSLRKNYSAQVNGPYKNHGVDGEENLIICAPSTMCDISCNIFYKDGVVTKSYFH